MNNVLFLICFTGLAVLPLAVLCLRAARPKLMPWWAVFSIVVGLGWGSDAEGDSGGRCGPRWRSVFWMGLCAHLVCSLASRVFSHPVFPPPPDKSQRLTRAVDRTRAGPVKFPIQTPLAEASTTSTPWDPREPSAQATPS